MQNKKIGNSASSWFTTGRFVSTLHEYLQIDLIIDTIQTLRWLQTRGG